MPGDEDQLSGSEVITIIASRLREQLPAVSQPELTQIETEIGGAHLDRGDDPARARHCAEWAIQLASNPEHGPLAHLIERLGASLREIGDTLRAAEIGLVSRSGVTNLDGQPSVRLGSMTGSVEATWVDEALRVAEEVAARSGWDAVGWQALLRDLAAIPVS